MTQIVDTTKPLTEDERRKVEAYAETLIASRPAPQSSGTRHIDVDGLIGLCAGMGGDKSDKALIRQAWADVVAKLGK